MAVLVTEHSGENIAFVNAVFFCKICDEQQDSVTSSPGGAAPVGASPAAREMNGMSGEEGAGVGGTAPITEKSPSQHTGQGQGHSQRTLT